jgi:hypothetical protein
MSLLWRVVLENAVVLAEGAFLLAITPVEAEARPAAAADQSHA